jgi:hypothetical protein
LRNNLIKYLIILAVLALAVAVAGCKQETQPQPQPNNTQQAPDAQTQPAGPPTYVEDGKTPEDHVNEYYTAYKDQDWEKVWKMAPAENKVKQQKDEFISSRKGMPIDGFKVNPAQTQDSQEWIDVEYDIPQVGTWVSTWQFEKKDDKWVAVSYKAFPKS